MRIPRKYLKGGLGYSSNAYPTTESGKTKDSKLAYITWLMMQNKYTSPWVLLMNIKIIIVA